jgi:predicted dehydrogenase
VLEAGRHLLTEKPLANSLADADALIDLAHQRGLTLACAPAIMAAPRYRWLARLLRQGVIGRPTLAVGQIGGLGPATWRSYTSDPRLFYGPGVGPVLDLGVYLLTAITGLLGPARRVAALAGISIPRRTVLGGPAAGTEFEVESDDNVLILLDFGNATFAQVLATFARPASRAPDLELHGSHGTISLPRIYHTAGLVNLYLANPGPSGVQGWLDGLDYPYQLSDVLVMNIAIGHVVEHLADGRPLALTAEHARHVLEVMLKAPEAARLGRTLDLTTTFEEIPL